MMDTRHGYRDQITRIIFKIVIGIASVSQPGRKLQLPCQNIFVIICLKQAVSNLLQNILFSRIYNNFPTNASYLQFNHNGFVVLEDLLTSEECDSLRVRCRELIDEFDLSTHPKSVFSTTNQVCVIEPSFL